MIPIVLKEIIVQERRHEEISVPDLAAKYQVQPKDIYNIMNTEPLAELYVKMFGEPADLNERNIWIKQQIEHFKCK